MGLIRSLVFAVVPERARRAMEAESRRWVARCRCGGETSVWEMGGLRYGASGSPRMLVRCGSCGAKFLGRLEYRGKPAGEGG